MIEAVAYLRKSTEDKQQHSFERQRSVIEAFCKVNGMIVVEWLTESISAKYGLENRPILRQAIEMNLPIVCADVSRLSRKVSVGSALVESHSKDFYFANIGMKADSLLVNVLLSVAQKEREMISQRVKQGMASAKVRGVKLGNPNAANDVKLAQNGNRKRGKASVEYYLPIIQDAQKLGCKSLREISEKMNSWGVKSPRGGKISHSFVKSILDRE